MNEQQREELFDKITYGISLAHKRLIENAKRNGRSLVVEKDGKIVTLSANEL